MVRLLERDEYSAAFGLIKLLRTHLDEPGFSEATAHPCMSGYRLAGAFDDGKLTGVVGFKPAYTLAGGHHLHVDDLVVRPDCRKHGIGLALMQWVEQHAREQGMRFVFLEARPGVGDFYAAMGYELHSSPLMRKEL